MRPGVEAEIQELLQIIEFKKMVYEREMSELRKRLLPYAGEFDSYAEWYCFVRKHTMTFKDFCKDMWDGKPYFEAAEEKKGK
jgi:hypothetical protein